MKITDVRSRLVRANPARSWIFIEVETDDPEGARQLVHARADAANITLFPQTRGKYARFVRALDA